MTEPATDKLLAETDGAIGWMTFNNPARHNAVSLTMWKAIPGILDDFEADADIRVIVVRGAGDAAFVSGADISEFEAVRSTPEAIADYEATADAASRRLQSVPKPTIAMIRGYCIGGGVGVALDCDLRIAGTGARFAIPAAKLGLGYDHAGIRRLVAVVGPANAKEIFFTARQFSAAEAMAMGLVNRVVADAELEAYVRDYCATIGANAPLTHLCVKRTVDELVKPDAEADLALCDELMERCFESEDYVEGRRAFLEKRKPVFRGR